MAKALTLLREQAPELEVEGIVVNQYQPRASLPQRVVDQLRTEGLPILDTFISSSVKMRESHDVTTVWQKH